MNIQKTTYKNYIPKTTSRPEVKNKTTKSENGDKRLIKDNISISPEGKKLYLEHLNGKKSIDNNKSIVK